MGHDITTGDELTPEDANLVASGKTSAGYALVRKHASATNSSLQDCLATFSSRSPLQLEGFVATDARGNRVKIKHPGWIALHHLSADGFLSHEPHERLIELVRHGDAADAMHFPQLQDHIAPLQESYTNQLRGLEDEWLKAKRIRSRKSFGLFAHRPSSLQPECLWALRNGSVGSPVQWLAQLEASKLLDVLHVSKGKTSKRLPKCAPERAVGVSRYCSSTPQRCS